MLGFRQIRGFYTYDVVIISASAILAYFSAWTSDLLSWPNASGQTLQRMTTGNLGSNFTYWF